MAVDTGDRDRARFGPGSRGARRRLLRTFAAQAVFWSVLVVATTGPARLAAAAPPVVTATLVQTILTSKWNPASPDPSGIVYLPGPQRLEITDSEVDETTGAGYHNVNLWQVTRTGTVTDTGTTYTPAPNFSREPTGLGFDPATNTLFISDDAKKKVFVDQPGTDGRFGTSDDVVTSIDTAYSTDTEDPEFDTTTGNPTSGHLFFLDGAATEIYDLDPVNGVFGDGNDVKTHFDIGYLGPSDFEALGSDPAANTLFVGTNKPSFKKIYEITKSGTLVRTIDASGISGLLHISGLAYAPASNGSGGKNFWIVDRQVDNGSNSSENDGKLFEITISSSSNNPPTVTNPGTKTNTVGDSVSYQILASDPDGDAIASYGATDLPAGLSVGTGTGLITGTTSTAGASNVTISATDSKGATGSTSFTWNVTTGSSSVLDIPVDTGADDAEQRSNGGMRLKNGDLDMMTDDTALNQAVGLRFAGVVVPQGAQVTSAFVQFRTDEAHSDPTSLTINGQASANAAPFATVKFDITNRPMTTNAVAWTPTPWTTVGEQGSAQQTADLSPVLTEIFSPTNGWAPGNALVLIIIGSGRRVADSFEGGAAPVLHLQYTV